MNLTEEQKAKVREAYSKLMPEEQEKLKKAFSKLNDEELSKVNGGFGLGDVVGMGEEIVGPIVNTMESFIDFLFGSSTSDVQGPKVNLEKCQFCGLLLPPTAMKDHMLNAHKEELVELIKQSGIF